MKRVRPTVHFVLGHSLLEVFGLEVVDVDADQCKGLVFPFRDERPLVRPTGPSGQSDLLPEIEEHDLAAVVAQLEANAVLVGAFDIGRLLADGQVTNPEPFGFAVPSALAPVAHLYSAA